MRQRSGGRTAVVVVVLAAVVLVYLTTRATPARPFSVESSHADGYRALALVAEQHGASVREVRASQLLDGEVRAEVVVVPMPDRLTREEHDALDERVRAGATVVWGMPHNEEPSIDELPFPDDLRIPGRELADVTAQPVAPGECTIAALEDLGPVDAAFAFPFAARAGDAACYSAEGGVLVTEREVGDGREVTLADPHLWVNARLQPAKESGGDPLDNAAMALRLLGVERGPAVAVVDVTPSSGAPPSGTRDPVGLLPLPVKLALVQGAVALVLYLWWRGRRLGRPVAERLPVEIAASELVDAVGDLLRRRGSSHRAAATMRADVRRDLSIRLGVPPGEPQALVERVAERTGRSPAEVAAALFDEPAPADVDLVQLAHRLDAIRQEALDDQPVR